MFKKGKISRILFITLTLILLYGCSIDEPIVDESDFSCKISFIDADTNITVAEVVTDTLGQFDILSNFKKVNSQYYIKDNAFYADKETDIPVTSLLIEKDDKDVLLYIKTYTKEELSDTSI